MNYIRCIKTVIIFIVLASFVSCKAKQDRPGESSSANREKAAATALPSEGKTAAPVALPKDAADARAAAVRVLAQLEAGDFAAIYRESAPGFKQIGSEADFVAKFQHTRQRVGVLKDPKETSLAARPEHIQVLVFRMGNERFTTDMRLSFDRAKDGKMELIGLNQHDEPKK